MATSTFDNRHRRVEINIVSARNLKLPTFSFGICSRTYAVAWVHPGIKKQTQIKCTLGRNPKWDQKFIFNDLNCSTDVINVEIYSVGCLFKDRLIGSMRVPVKDIISPDGGTMSLPSFTIRRSSRKSRGVVILGGKVGYDFPAKSFSSVLASLGMGTRFSALPMSTVK